MSHIAVIKRDDVFRQTKESIAVVVGKEERRLFPPLEDHFFVVVLVWWMGQTTRNTIKIKLSLGKEIE